MPTSYNTLPSYEYLHEALIYRPRLGAFIWRARPKHHFPTESGWRVFKFRDAGNPAGYIHHGYRMIWIDKGYNASRIAWMMMTSEDPGPYRVDHKNTIKSDDRWCNLRLATSAQNNQNAKTKKNSLTGLKGITRNWNRWSAEIRANGTRHYLGTYPTPEAAHAAYVEAANRLHGSFARVV